MKIPPTTIGIGAGGHAKVLLDILLEQNQYSVIGLLDADSGSWGSSVFGVPILGGDALLDELIAEKKYDIFSGGWCSQIA